MNVSSLQSVLDLSAYGTNTSVSSTGNDSKATDRTSAFESIFNAAMDQINETNDLSNQAEEEEINFALGLSDSTHDLQIAQQKANISLSYTVALRKTVLEAYKEIMNLQF
ncbi:MAG: flagellar hook-basal body complex protein FliE [bacterium]|nr:flagellar hook-basal body complex protein FliE [bacterium]